MLMNDRMAVHCAQAAVPLCLNPDAPETKGISQ